MRRIVLLFLAAVAVSLATAAAAGNEQVDLTMVSRIRDEGFNHSAVMEIASRLTDQIGPRLTGSPQLKEANDWTRQQFEDWGLANAHLEAWGPFGRGWSFSRVGVYLDQPHREALHALPKAWSPGTQGPIKGEAMRVEIKTEQDLETYRGKLAGKILLLSDSQNVVPSDGGPGIAGPPGAGTIATGAAAADEEEVRRYSDTALAKLSDFPTPNSRDNDRRRDRLKVFQLRQKLDQYFQDEKAAAVIEASNMPWGGIRVQGTQAFKKGQSAGVPSLVMAAEQYNRLLRLLKDKEPVVLEVDVEAQFLGDEEMAFNTLAELPGSDLKSEIVMAGAHLDSWHAGTGATDNAAGCAVVMEAARILRALGVKPRRTIRFALWTGEEQGLLGSTAYVSQHFASRPEPKDPTQRALPAFLREESTPLTYKPEYARLDAYFNIDNGSGKLRGIFAQENLAARQIFEAWLAPFKDLSADTVTLRDTGSTDHVPFDRVGLPGFQFIQDPLDYMQHTHHTDMDVYDHLDRGDMVQAAVVLASVLYDAANRPEMMPRKAISTPHTPAVAPVRIASSPASAKSPAGARPATAPPADTETAKATAQPAKAAPVPATSGGTPAPDSPGGH